MIPMDKIIEMDAHIKNKLKIIVKLVRLLNFVFVSFTDIVDCLKNIFPLFKTSFLFKM
jgi:hypothetical protein